MMFASHRGDHTDQRVGLLITNAADMKLVDRRIDLLDIDIVGFSQANVNLFTKVAESVDPTLLRLRLCDDVDRFHGWYSRMRVVRRSPHRFEELHARVSPLDDINPVLVVDADVAGERELAAAFAEAAELVEQASGGGEDLDLVA